MKEFSLLVIGAGLGFIITHQVMRKQNCKRISEAGDRAWNEAMDTAHENFKKLLSYGARMNTHPSVLLKIVEQK